MKFFGKVLIGLSSLALSNITFAGNHYPCSGAPGAYYTNPDQSIGGFVAKTATVDNTIILEPETSVCDRAVVIEGVQLKGRAIVSGKATVRGDVVVSDEAQIYGEAYVINPGGGYLEVKDYAKIYGHGFLQGSVIISDESEVYGWGKVIEFAQLQGFSKVCGRSVVKGFDILTDDQTNCAQK